MPAPTALELLWGTQQRARRGPKPALSLERIVGEAIALADAEGLTNLSMQRLAERLGFTKMSLYRYVPGKAELTALMLDAAIGTPPEPTADWRAGLQTWADLIFARYSAHPWAIDLTTGQRPVGPNELGWMETALTALAGTGLTGSERLDTIVLLNGHVRSHPARRDNGRGRTPLPRRHRRLRRGSRRRPARQRPPVRHRPHPRRPRRTDRPARVKSS
jgi:AcrR family transcriptional regulator